MADIVAETPVDAWSNAGGPVPVPVDTMGDRPLVEEFPQPGPSLRRAYAELATAVNGTDQEIKALGNLGDLPRPWIPSTLVDRTMRQELWVWLERAVVWFNHQMIWTPDHAIVPCWTKHPPLINEILVLADRRYRATTALDTAPLEEWHRYSWPAFVTSSSQQLAGLCRNGHDEWPARPRFDRYLGDPATAERQRDFTRDTNDIGVHADTTARPLRLVDGQHIDVTTGEILD